MKATVGCFYLTVFGDFFFVVVCVCVYMSADTHACDLQYIEYQRLFLLGLEILNRTKRKKEEAAEEACNTFRSASGPQSQWHVFKPQPDVTQNTRKGSR